MHRRRTAKANQGKRPQQPNDLPRATQAEAQTTKIFALTCEIEDSLGAALSYADALELMGFGMQCLGDDYSAALITVVETLMKHLKSAKSACRLILDERKDPENKDGRRTPEMPRHARAGA
jgi:hypothetical protein